jgi:integrase
VRHGQQRVNGRLRRGNTKNKASKRTLPLFPDLVAWLRDHAELQVGLRAKFAPDYPWNPERLVFCRADGTPVSSESYGRQFRKVTEAAKIDAATPYALRHTCCTLLVLANVPLPDVAKLMGHTDLTMVTKVYAHHRRGLVTIPEDAMPSLLGAA